MYQNHRQPAGVSGPSGGDVQYTVHTKALLYTDIQHNIILILHKYNIYYSLLAQGITPASEDTSQQAYIQGINRGKNTISLLDYKLQRHQGGLSPQGEGSAPLPESYYRLR